jgi:hypothetical protein
MSFLENSEVVAIELKWLVKLCFIIFLTMF